MKSMQILDLVLHYIWKIQGFTEATPMAGLDPANEVQ